MAFDMYMWINVLQDFEHDIHIAKAAFIKKLLRMLLIGSFKAACSTTIDPVRFIDCNCYLF